ncbi:cell wall-active antibiotics response protein LiaF [Brevibacillus fluminis]|uniref:cell wall-active antibiotics response protein LiaF n=1 Tax=Brevibacillus fluminis TaxID=511487 RepID=UPI003F8A8578
MKQSRVNTIVAGLVIIAAGIGLFLDSLHLIHFSIFMLWPFLFFYFGMKLWTANRRIFGGVLLGLGAVFALDEWLHVDAFDLIFPLLFIYLGYRLIRHRNGERGRSLLKDFGQTEPQPEQPSFGPIPPPNRKASEEWQGPIFRQAETRSTFIGDFHLTSGRFELTNLHIWHGIGDVVIDLSRALIPEEETLLVVKGWVGDLTIYVPVDLPVSVNASVTIGDLEVFGHRQGGLNRQVMMRSEHFDTAPRKVKLILSLHVGDIDVKYI